MLKQKDLLESEEAMTLERKRAFLKLPLSERRKILSEQADAVAHQYESEQSTEEREPWQHGED